MTFITGEQLRLLEVPEQPRRQLQRLTEYLHAKGAANHHVCALYGLRRTGKTTLILQAIQHLLAEGVAPEKIGYFTGMKEDSFDDLYVELETYKNLSYIFIDEIGFFGGFLTGGNYLYDVLVRLRNCKVVIAGTNLLALYVAGKRTLYDRCRLILVPYLSFYEHCKFVLGNDDPSQADFIRYLQYGGLFAEPKDVAEYVQTSITDSIVKLFDTQPEHEVFVWLKPESEEVNWKGYVNTVMMLSSNYVSSRSLQRPPAMIQDFEVLDTKATRQVVREFRQYFSLSAQDREYRMKRTETVALLDFPVHCGVIVVLPNRYNDAEPYKCYVAAPFLRFHFTDKLRDMLDAKILDDNKPLFGELLEAAVVSEYQQSHKQAQTCFARTHHPEGSDNMAEIDLLDLSAKLGYEVKLTGADGYKGFSQLGPRPEFEGFSFTVLDRNNYIQQIYDWGKASYQKVE
jgi:hypothetical protein